MPSEEASFFRYLPVAERDMRFGLYVTGAGHSNTPPGSPYPPSTHPPPYNFTWQKGRVLPEYQVGYITRGEGVFESGPTGRRKVVAGNVILLFPGVWHRIAPDKGTGWEEWWVGFNGEYLKQLVREGFICPENPVLETGMDQAILQPYQSILNRIQTAPRGYPLLIAADTLEILAASLALVHSEPAKSLDSVHGYAVEDRMVVQAVDFIWGCTVRPMTVDDVVASLPITRRSLERRFRCALGHSVFEEITRCRLVRAERLLTETKLPIQQVALTAGFSGTERMSKVFHRIKGISPWAYRRQHQP